MAALQFDIPFSAVALVAATPKTVVGVKAPTNQAIKVLEIGISFDGAISTYTPALVEICSCTFATNAPGTNSTSATPDKRDLDRHETIQTTSAYNWTTEPTVIAVKQAKYVGQFNGLYHYILPFAVPVIVPGGKGLAVRVTSPNSVNCAGHLTVEE